MHPGDLIEGFDIAELAGSGGMARVYRGREQQTGRAVALKLLGSADHADKKRFAREVRVLSDLRHPGIVRYFAHGLTIGGKPYLAMEWLEGEDLKARLAREGLTVEESVMLGRRVAEALGEAHASGVVHRDIKPSNLFLCGKQIEQIKVIDFGLARGREEAGSYSESRAGIVVGTLGYMAPEQARGSLDIDARADVFSLGCVLFECLTGQPAFAGDHLMAVLAKILLEDAPRVSEFVIETPRALDDLVARMLCKDPEGRPHDGKAVLAELTALGAMVSAPESRIPVRPALTEGEQRIVSVIVATAALASEGSGSGGGAVATHAASPADASALYDRLRAILLPFGGHIEALAEGSVVATIAGRGSATDQAAQAARCTLAMRDVLSDAEIVLATGRGVLDGRLPVGDAIDRAISLFRAQSARRPRASMSASPPAPPQPARRPVYIDDVTAGLLGARFDVAGRQLRGEHAEIEQETRTLLGKPTACVGREREFTVLGGIFEECIAEPMAAAVLLTGMPGIGKSRVRYEFLRSVRKRAENAEVWIARGDPIRASSPFGMIAELLRSVAGLLDGEPLDARRKKLRARVARSVAPVTAASVAEFLGEIAGAPFPDEDSEILREARRDLARMGERMRWAWEEFLAAECTRHPVVMVLEDLHWGDMPSVQLVDAAIQGMRERELPLLVLALARPDVHERFPKLWSERGVVQIRLLELSRRASERLVRDVLGERVPPEMVQRVVAQAEGNAFYLEELIRAVAEGKGDALPDTVLAMVQARLSSLPPEARRVMRASSVFGMVFWRGGMRGLLGNTCPAQDLSEWLAVLEERELIVARLESRFPGEEEYTFRHALVREGAYGMLTEGDRALGHRIAGAWLEQMGEQDAMVLAEHFERGGERERAAVFYQRAADQALRANDLGELRLLEAEAQSFRGKYAESREHAEEALSLLPRGSSPWFSAARSVCLAAFQLGDAARLATLSDEIVELAADEPSGAGLTACLQAAICELHFGKGAHADAIIARVASALHVHAAASPLVRAELHRYRAVRGSFDGEIRIDEMAEAAECYGEAQSHANECVMRGHIGDALIKLGAFEEADVALRNVIAAATRLGLENPAAAARSTLGLALLRRGDLAAARAEEEAAIAALRTQGDLRLEGYSRSYLSQILAESRDLAGAEREARAAVALVDRSPSAQAYALITLSSVLLASGRAADAVEVASSAHRILEDLHGIEDGEALIRVVYAEALIRSGDERAARAVIHAAHARVLQRAGRIHDDERRRSFLEAVPENARTLALATRIEG
jgi:eukaryotic-like serine/threonine-protein kinase